MSEERKIPSENRDPLSGEAGAHPVGTGVGAALGGAAAGAAVGTVAGPIGTAVGAAVGAVAGGLFGKSVAEGLDPTVEDAYWRDNYSTRPYVVAGSRYEQYQAAYRHGWESRARSSGQPWRDMEGQVRQDWETRADRLDMDWDAAREAVRDAYERVPLEPGSPVNRV